MVLEEELQFISTFYICAPLHLFCMVKDYAESQKLHLLSDNKKGIWNWKHIACYKKKKKKSSYMTSLYLS